MTSGRAVGIDLAGSPNRTTGFCSLEPGGGCQTSALRSDAEIDRAVHDAAPSIVSIDAPLSLPRGRRTIDDRSGPHFRQCDLDLRARGIRFFPITLGPMRMLTERGIRLRRRLETQDLRVIECYPGGAQDVWGIPRKQAGLERLRRALRRFGVTGDIGKREITHDELDAITAALVGMAFLRGEAEVLGDPMEGELVLPSRKARRSAVRKGKRD